MSVGLYGAMAGFVFGVVNFFILRNVARAVENQRTETSAKTAKVLNIVAWIDIVVFAIAGYFLAPLVVG
ncbi:MAG: hypothetical protein AAFR04_08270 [Pseudomonadota bacterium]